MTLLYPVVNHTTILAADVNQYKNLLEGAAGYTGTFFLNSTASTDFIVRLGSGLGTTHFTVQNNSGSTLFDVARDGTISAFAISPTTLTLPINASPSQTVAGQIVWDSDDKQITVGDGTSRQIFKPSNTVYKYKSSTQAVTTTTTYADVIAVSGVFAFTMAASEVWAVEYRLPLTLAGTGGVKFQLTGPSAPTTVAISAEGRVYANTYSGPTDPPVNTPIRADLSGATAFSSDVIAADTGTSTGNIATGMFIIHAFIINGVNAGTVTLQVAQHTSNNTTTLGLGSYMKAERMS